MRFRCFFGAHLATLVLLLHGVCAATARETSESRKFEESADELIQREIFKLTTADDAGTGFDALAVSGEIQNEMTQRETGVPQSCLFALSSCQSQVIFQLPNNEVLDIAETGDPVDDEILLRSLLTLDFIVYPTRSLLDHVESMTALRYAGDLIGDSGAVELVEKIVFWHLDDNDDLRVRAQYRHGDMPLTHDETVVITIGFRVKF